MRRFILHRHEDETGVSGTGVVAWGCLFPNGKVAMTWATGVSSCTWFDSIEHVAKIHGHDGLTEIKWRDTEWEDRVAELLTGDERLEMGYA
jgi:hypothetical protein